MDSLKGSRHFIEDIIDGMFDWVRVMDKDDNVIYMNKAMSDNLKNPVIGTKCYEAVGRSKPCENCTSRRAVFDGHSYEKEELIGNQVFSVMSSPVKNREGETIAVVEVLRDTTQLKHLQQQILKQNKKLKDELSMARKLQCSLLPKELPEDKVSFSFIYKPCEALGGDFLDIFKIDDNHIGLYIADVSGHGVPASMLTIFLRSSFNKKSLSPSQALKDLYKEFNNSSLDENLYITMFYAILDLKAKTMAYSNAGHNVSPVIFNTGRFELLRLPGIPISNWLEDPAYEDACVKLNTGDRLFFYTDGIVEMRNKANEQFGDERLLELLLNNASEPTAALNGMVDEACRFAGLTSISDVPDDITMALLKIK